MRAIEDDTRPSGVPARSAAGPAAFGAVVGAFGGMAFGFFLGPAATVIGGILGAIGGAGLGDAIARIQEHRTVHDERVDEEIGVLRGNLGSAPPDQPPAWIGAYSAGSAGAGGGAVDVAPDEGPIPKAD